MTTKTRVFCTTSFEGFHRWPEAPSAVFFLRDTHRHIFHVRCEMSVIHDDRDIEFILLKRKVDAYIQETLHSRETINWSCEMWARDLLVAFGFDRVEVSEDEENGSVVERVEDAK